MNLIVKSFNDISTVELYEILKSRAAVFVVEQNINYQDMDDIDYRSLHCFFMEDKKVVAYLRAFYEDESNSVVRMGRVLTLEHGKGLGEELILKSLVAIKENMNAKKIVGHAQAYALPFYEKYGFKSVGDVFIEEGIEHISVELDL